MKKITPFLWFNDQAEEAVDFYVSFFKDSQIKKISYYNAASAKVSGRPEGSIMSIYFEINGQEFGALNGGPEFTFSLATSFMINCDNQDEIDTYWAKLSEGGKIYECGWLTDKFGVTWQVVPTILNELLSDPDPIKAQKVMEAMLTMKKLDINKLKKAYSL